MKRLHIESCPSCEADISFIAEKQSGPGMRTMITASIQSRECVDCLTDEGLTDRLESELNGWPVRI